MSQRRRVNFSRTPQVGEKSRVSGKAAKSQLSPEIEVFRSAYVFERRLLERFRDADCPLYSPAAKYDGVVIYDTPEEPVPVNQWQQSYLKISSLPLKLSPVRYLQFLFYALRNSSLAIPTVTQLAAKSSFDLVADLSRDVELTIRAQYIGEAQRAARDLRIAGGSTNQTSARAVLSLLLDGRLEFSPLFRYCLAWHTIQRVYAKKAEQSATELKFCDRLIEHATACEFLAVHDYLLFQSIYDQIWSGVIPDQLNVAVKRAVTSA